MRAISPSPTALAKRWMVFNGEIYNFKSLRKEISTVLPAYRWRTTSDTEVLLASYLAWGEKCFEKLNGMFALAIWDQTDGTLLFARDRMGQKPLYYAALGADGKAWDHEHPPMVIAFGSELSTLRQTGWMDASINHSALGDYLRFGYVPTPATIYNGAWKLPPGTWMKIGRDSVQVENYWDPNALASVLQHAGPEAPSPNSTDSKGEQLALDPRAEAHSPKEIASPTDDDARKRTRELVTQAVRRQLVADVPIGCFLSGGVDSSIIAFAMKSLAGKDQRVHTFSIGFDDPLYDETKYAAEVAKHLGTKHKQFTVEFDAADDLPKLAPSTANRSAIPRHCQPIISRAKPAST